jgi:phosphohistidine swiveling domain-containing protein
MKMSFSSVDSRGSYVAYKVSSKNHGSFTIISYAKDFTGDFNVDEDFHAFIEDDSISLTASDKRLPSVLRIGNKSLNQLKLGQLSYFIPDTVALDFSFFDIFKKNSQIDLKEIYNQHIAESLGPLLAIRCSSNLEDSERKSFAGVFDTYLNVPNQFEEFEEKILRSYQKFCSKDEANPNDSLQDIRRYDLKLGIMVQRLVKPKFTGFLFTTHPMNPPNQWLKIEYWQGEREKSEEYSITLNSENGKRIPTSRDNSAVPLPAEPQEKLYYAAKELEEYFGFPQDVEFVISEDDEQLYLVQSRPITAFSYSPDKVYFDEQKRLSEILKENLAYYQKAPILSSTNISELFVRAVPLGYSIFRYGFAGTYDKEGGISIGRARLGYAKLDLPDQLNFFYTVADQARTNIIVDALTFRLPGFSKEQYLDTFVSHYLKKIEQNPTAALYPEDGLYLQNDESERWHEIAGDKGDTFRREYSDFLQHLIDHHALNEYKNAGNFFSENERFYRSYFNHALHSASENSLKKEIEGILEYLRTSFCPQYVVIARLAFLCTHVAKQKLQNLLNSETPSSIEHILNELLRNVEINPELNGPNYPLYERLWKTGQIALGEFLDKFQHLGSLDISQPRLGEYSTKDLSTIFGEDKNYEHGDAWLQDEDIVMEIDPQVSALGLERIPDFWTWCTSAGRFMRLREKAKSELLKVLYVLKRVVRELARRYRLGDLVYYLEYNEVLGLTADNRNEYRLLALQRHAYFEACKQHRVREVLSDFETTPFEKKQRDGIGDAERRYKSVKGQSIFYGQAEGICLTAHSNEEYLKKLAAYKADKIESIIGVFKGVELSYFNLSALAGFTTENGGYLSHAATIAREFRITYITGIRLDNFQDGDHVFLDTEHEQVIFRK